MITLKHTFFSELKMLCSSLAHRRFVTSVLRATAVLQPCTTNGDSDPIEIPIELSTAGQIKVITGNSAGWQHSAPLARVSITFAAGSRYESPPTTVGAAHYIRRCMGLKSGNGSAFLTTRTGQQYGIAGFARADREHITMCVVCKPAHICEALCCLKQACTEPLFLPWELETVRSLVSYDHRHLDEVGRSIDLLHMAAYRRGLGRSMVCPEYRWRALCPPALRTFYQQTCRPDRCTVAALNVNVELIQQFAGSLKFGQATTETPALSQEKSAFHADVRRLHTPSRWSHVAVGGETSGSGDRKEQFAAAVLQNVLGNGSVIDCTTTVASDVGVLARAVAKACPDSVFRCEALHASYSDSGLFGFQLNVEPSQVRAALQAALAVMRGDVNKEDVARGRAKLRASVLFAMESEQGWMDEMAAQMVLGGKWSGVKELLAEVDAVTAADVQGLLTKLGGDKMAMAAVGNLDVVPYMDEL